MAPRRRGGTRTSLPPKHAPLSSPRGSPWKEKSPLPHLPAGSVFISAGGSISVSAIELGLETVDLKPGSWLEVDDSLRVRGVTGDWLYAAGDVNHRVLLTHMGKYQGRICGNVIAARAKGIAEAATPELWSRYSATADNSVVPQVIFTDPEVASVGLTEAAAKARGINARAIDYDIGSVAGASLYSDGYRGNARMVVDEERRVLIGMTLVGPSVGELIHAATVAIVGTIPITRLWHAVPSYPTISEIWLRLLETFDL